MTGRDIVEIARPHAERNEPYIFGSLVPKDDTNWRGPWDCAEFVSWCVFQVSERLYGCRGNHPSKADAYTGYWNDDSITLGKRITVNEAATIPGAAVLRIGVKSGHIVISDGLGSTIEAMSERRGVTFSTLSQRRWDVGILVPWISYETNDTPAPKPPPSMIYRLTVPYMRGDKVREIQTALRDADFFWGTIDGIFGPQTFNAVLRFQEVVRLVVDGEVGPQTLEALWLGE
jgi:hypothetical protein